MSDLKTYLASKYMSGPKADAILARSGDGSHKKKKKKPKNEDYIGGSSSKAEGSGSGGLMFRDEDEEWNKRYGDDEDMDGEDAPVVGKDIATFKKSKSQWATVGGTALPMTAAAVEAADTTGTETGQDVSEEPAAPPVQLTKRKGGLRTAAQVREEAALLAAQKQPSPEPIAQEGGIDPTATVHRDASGRILDVEALKEEERKQVEEENRKAKEREEWSKGFAQREARKERAKEEAEMRTQDVARRADDVRMNREMREVERWNDPAAEFITKKKKAKGPRRPRYQGSFAPNRFGIAPGFRWDGVDRSNGFEKKFFQYQNAAARKEYEQNQWSMEDM